MTNFLEQFAMLPMNLGMSIKNIFDGLSSSNMLESLVYIFVPFFVGIVASIIVDIFKSALRKRI